MRTIKGIVTFILVAQFVLLTGCSEMERISKKDYDTLQNTLNKQIEKNEALEEEINVCTLENQLLSDKLDRFTEDTENIDYDPIPFDELIEFENGQSDRDTLEKVFKACPVVLDGAFSESYSSELEYFYDKEGACSFIHQLAKAESYNISDIVECLTGDIGIIYYNTEGYSVNSYITELKEVITTESLNSRELQIAYHLLADFEALEDAEK